MPIPFIDLAAQNARLKDDINHRIQSVIGHGQFIMGPEVVELEDVLCAYTGSKHTITMSSGTDALLAILMAHSIGPGDAVFLPAFTFPATAEVIILIGARPVFVDVHADTCNMDTTSLNDAITRVKTSGRYRPKAVFAVDLYGLPADYSAIGVIAQRENMILIADAAQSIGGSWNDKKVGTLAHATATSFFPAKPLGCYGDGGAVFTDDDDLAQALRSIRAHGKGDSKYDIDRIGLNARMDTIQAAVLLSKLTIFDDEIERRESISRVYDACLGNRVQLPGRQSGSRSAWAQYTIQVDDRDALAAALKGNGIPTAVYYPRPLHMQTAYNKFAPRNRSLQISEELSRSVLSLPMHPYLGHEEAQRIGDTIRSILSS